MYSTCLFCHASLGANEAIEPFPVGRRLAFDSAKGRLWVVCTRCGRWNLSPLEERWEALDECERRFRDTRLRASTDNVGLARLPDGTELVRIGKPERPEFAAWRYADEIRRRRRRGLARDIVVPTLGILFAYGAAALEWRRARRVVCSIPRGAPGDSAGTVLLREGQLNCVVWDPPDEGRDWRLRVYQPDDHPGRPARHVATLEGATARTVAARVLARLNRSTGTRVEVQDAVRVLETTGDPFQSARAIEVMWNAAGPRARARRLASGSATPSAALGALNPAYRLAMEMAANEETERRAMEGELAALEAAWRDAEEIAAIADGL